MINLPGTRVDRTMHNVPGKVFTDPLDKSISTNLSLLGIFHVICSVVGFAFFIAASYW